MSREALEELLTTSLDKDVWYPDVRSDSIWMKCPNPEHLQTGKSPPFKVNTDETSQFYGQGHCFSCGLNLGLKELLRALGLRGSGSLRPQLPHELYRAEEIDDMRGKKRPAKPEKQLVTEEWPEKSRWRGIRGSLVRDVGGRMVIAGDGRDPLLILPAYVRGVERGYVKCRVFPKRDGFDYVNAGGKSWSKDVLFPYDYVAKRLDEMDGPRIVAGVEGTRDALQTIQNGVMALATLGSQSWSEKCAALVRSLSPDVFLCMADPDDAGAKLERMMYNSLYRYMDVRVVRLPSRVEQTPRGPRRVKVKDPADLDRAMLKKILSKLGIGDQNEHSTKRPSGDERSRKVGSTLVGGSRTSCDGSDGLRRRRSG